MFSFLPYFVVLDGEFVGMIYPSTKKKKEGKREGCTLCYCAHDRWHQYCQRAALIRELAIWILPQITLKFQAQKYIKLNEYWIQGPQTALMEEKPCATQLFCGQTWSIHCLYSLHSFFLLFPPSPMGSSDEVWSRREPTDSQEDVHMQGNVSRNVQAVGGDLHILLNKRKTKMFA